MTNGTAGVFEGVDGTVIIEAESAGETGNWEQTTIDGETVLLWDSNRSNYNKIEESEKLAYTFTVDESGDYHLATRAARDYSVMNNSDRWEGGDPGDELRTDTGNDAYYGIYDVEEEEYVQVPTKLYTFLGSNDETLKWGRNFDDSSGHYNAVVELEADKEYRLEVVGRSDGYALDRITLNKDSRLEDNDIAQSNLVAASADTPPEDDSSGGGPSGDAPAADGPYEDDAVADEGASSDDDDGGSIFSFIGDFFSGFFGIFSSIFGGGDDDDDDDEAEPSSAEASGQFAAYTGAEMDLPVVVIEEDAAVDGDEDDTELLII